MVGKGGFEPPKSETTDLQSAPFSLLGISPYKIKMVGVTGLEPAAPWSQTTYATICATPRLASTISLYIKVFEISSEILKIFFCSNILLQLIYILVNGYKFRRDFFDR